MTKIEDRKLEELAIEAARVGMSRQSFIRRALALGVTTSAIAGALEALEGPASAHAATSSQTTINFSSWGSLTEQVTANQVLEVFSKRYPNITVQPRYTDFTDYFIKLNADLATKSIADVMFLTNVPTYASKGALMDIRAMAKAHGKDLAGYTKGDLFLFEWNGGLYGVPLDTDTHLIFYNRKLFRKAGLPYPKEGWSYDDLRATAMKLTLGSGARKSQYGYAFETPFWRLWFWENGVELFDSYANPTKAIFNTPAGAQALQFMADLINKDQVTPPATQMTGSATIVPLFAAGQVAMAFGNHPEVPAYVQTPGLDWFVVGMPHFAGHPPVTSAGGAGYTISKFTKSPNAAYQLWDFLTGPVASLMFASGNDIVPISPAALRTAAWTSKPYNKVFAQETRYGHAFPSFATWGTVSNAIDSALQPIWTGEQTAAQALPAAEAAANKLIKG